MIIALLLDLICFFPFLSRYFTSKQIFDFFAKPLNWNFNLFSHHWILTLKSLLRFFKLTPYEDHNSPNPREENSKADYNFAKMIFSPKKLLFNFFKSFLNPQLNFLLNFYFLKIFTLFLLLNDHMNLTVVRSRND